MSADKILERVRKMLTLANNEGATEGERDTALQMAHNLMAKHQLDLLDVVDHIKDKEDPRMHFQEEGWNLLWTQQIRMSVAKLFGVKYFLGRKINATRGTHHFVGRESAAKTAMLLCDWIVRDSLRKADKFGVHRLNPKGRAFGVGVASMLSLRVGEMLKKKGEEIKETTGRDLVLIQEDEKSANEDYIEDVLGIKLKSRSLRRTRIDIDGHAAGMAHGKTINLSTQLANKAGTLALK
jgi:Protein of unknown function (DUF2786)